MARPLRIEYPGAYYHVINRGNAGEDIFRSDSDCERFLEYLAAAVVRFSISLHGYCLMTNHYHLIVETPQANLSAAIQWLNVSYAIWFNKKHQRCGHLYQGRFKSILVDADAYLAQLSRYIHLNPVKANMVKTPIEYDWSSYSVFIGNTKKSEWLDISLLQGFGKQQETAIRNYQKFVEEMDIDKLANPNNKAIGGCILGGESFVAWVQEKFLAIKPDNKEMPQLNILKPAISLEHIVHTVSVEFGCRPEVIMTPGQKGNLPRETTIYLAHGFGSRSGKDLGEYFGGISGAAITMCGKKFSLKLLKDRKLQKRVEKVRKRIFSI